MDLPVHLVEQIMSAFVDQMPYKNVKKLTKTLGALTCSCSLFKGLLDPDHIAWQTLRDMSDIDICDKKYLKNMNARRVVQLDSCTGCEICKKPRIRKVHWQFKVRCCKECLYANTVSDYRLGNDYGIPYEEIRHIPHTIADMYTNGKSYMLQFFWKSDPELLAIGNNLHGSACTNMPALCVKYNEIKRLKAEEDIRLAKERQKEIARVAKEKLNEKNVKMHGMISAFREAVLGKWYEPCNMTEFVQKSEMVIKSVNKVKKFESWMSKNIDKIANELLEHVALKNLQIAFGVVNDAKIEEIKKDIAEIGAETEDSNVFSVEYIHEKYSQEYFEFTEKYPQRFRDIYGAFIKICLLKKLEFSKEFMDLALNQDTRGQMFFPCPLCTNKSQARSLIGHICNSHSK